MVPFPVTSSDP